MMHTDPILKFADRHAALNARGNLDTTSDDEATVVFDKVWKLEDQILATEPRTMKGVVALLEIVAGRLVDGTHQIDSLKADVGRALALLKQHGTNSFKATVLVNRALTTLQDAGRTSGYPDRGLEVALTNASHFIRDFEPRLYKTRGALAPGAYVAEQRYWQRLRQSKPDEAPTEGERLTEDDEPKK